MAQSKEMQLKPEEPVLGVKPYYVAAWQRIVELAEAIERQYQSYKGDTELVQMWAAEIGWQCSIIESLNDSPNESPNDVET